MGVLGTGTACALPGWITLLSEVNLRDVELCVMGVASDQAGRSCRIRSLYAFLLPDRCLSGWPAFGTITLLTFLLAVIVVGVSFLRWKATEYAVTNKRLIVKSGIITHNSEEIMVDKVESIGVDQGFWGRQLDYGTLVLRGTGSTFEPFFHVPSPMEFWKCILTQAASRS